MPLRHIVGYLYLAFAAVFAVGQSLALFFLGARSHDWTPADVGSIALNWVLAAAAAGLLLLKRPSRPWLWLAVFVAGLGLFKFNVWPLLAYGRFVGFGMFHFFGPLWVIFMDLATHFMLPVMFFLSVKLLFQSDTAVSAPATGSTPGAATPAELPAGFTPVVRRHSSLFGVLSLAFFGIGMPIVGWMVIMRPGRNGAGELAATLQVISLPMFLCGFICVMIAFIRWEKRLVLPLLGYTVGVAPMLYFSWMASSIVFCLPTIFGILFCAACTIASIKTGERGRTWSLLRAIPSGFAVLFLIEPLLNFLLVRE